MEPAKPKAPFLIQLMRKSAKKPGPNVVPPGRIYYAAQFPVDLEGYEKLVERYHEILESLTYREAMAWCRGWGRRYSTYLMRRYRHREPKPTEVYLTVAWFDAGKPVEGRDRKTIAPFEQLLEAIRQHNAQGIPAPESSTSPSAEHPL